MGKQSWRLGDRGGRKDAREADKHRILLEIFISCNPDFSRISIAKGQKIWVKTYAKSMVCCRSTEQWTACIRLCTSQIYNVGKFKFDFRRNIKLIIINEGVSTLFL